MLQLTRSIGKISPIFCIPVGRNPNMVIYLLLFSYLVRYFDRLLLAHFRTRVKYTFPVQFCLVFFQSKHIICCRRCFKQPKFALKPLVWKWSSKLGSYLWNLVRCFHSKTILWHQIVNLDESTYKNFLLYYVFYKHLESQRGQWRVKLLIRNKFIFFFWKNEAKHLCH